MYVMYDDVTVSTIPRSAPAVAGYVGGAWPTFGQLKAHWPHAHRLSIAVNAGEDAECLDVESGDATPADAPGWFHRQRSHGVAKPVFYASVSNMQNVIDALANAGIHREQYRVWTAHYTYHPHICGKEEGLGFVADATQWTDKALGSSLDESLCNDEFFRRVVASNPLDDLLPAERRLVNTYDKYIKHPRLHRHGLGVTVAALVYRRKLIWLAAVKGKGAHGEPLPKGWGIRHRQTRYALLWARTRGNPSG